MTFTAAAEFLAVHAGWGLDIDPQEVLDRLDDAYRTAAKALHPDVGGDPELFKLLGQAREIVEAHQ